MANILVKAIHQELCVPMSTAESERVFTASRIFHWLGCLLGTAIAFLFLAFAFGGKEEPPPVSSATVALGVMISGYLLAWWSDWLGGFVSLAAIVGFYAWTYLNSGVLLGGPVFPLCFVPGALCLLATWMRRRECAI
jgi:hypothetical protein